MTIKAILGDIIGWGFGFCVMAAGILNMFWGNDPGFGVFLFILAFAFLPPVNDVVRKIFGFSIPIVLKIILGIFIIWAVLGVGELSAKLNLMMRDL